MISATVPVLTCWKPVPAHMFTCLRIACPHRRRAQRAGQPVDLRISERRLGLMLVDEPVAQPARVAAGKCPRHNGFGELRILQRGSVHRAAARFVRQQERRSELGRGRARRQARGRRRRAVINPPAATTGTSTAALTSASSSSRGWVAGCADGSKVPRCPPADGPCTATASTPRSTAVCASGSVVTVPTTVMPASRSRRHSSALGTPKVNDATSGRRSSSTSILAAQWSSSNRGSPSWAP